MTEVALPMPADALPPAYGQRKSLRRPVDRSPGHPLVRFVIRRVSFGLLTLWIISVLIFLGTQALPGDAAQAILGKFPNPESVERLREVMHLNEPLVVQYWQWFSGVLSGDLGVTSAGLQSQTNQTVASAIAGPLQNSLILGLAALLVMVPVGFYLGALSAVKQGTWIDNATAVASLTFVSLPEFVGGAMLILVFGIGLGILPATSILIGGETPLTDPIILVLPVLTIVSVTVAQIVRMVRACMIEALQSDYVMAARLAGIDERRVLVHFALRNALAPSIQVLAQNVQYLVGGLIVTELVFSYPGIGVALQNAVNLRDIPTVQSIALIIAALTIAVNIVADFLVTLAVPRVRTAQ